MPPTSLDPADWPTLRQQAHRMLDDMLDHVQHIREQPVWRPISDEVRGAVKQPMPAAPVPLAEAHHQFMTQMLPHAVGNLHPRFMGWVHGAGTVQGMLAEMLAAGLNANLGGRDQMPLELERQVVRWMADLYELPPTAGGVFVTGSSMANFMGVLAARTRALGKTSRQTGVAATSQRLVAYAATSVHGCVAKAMEMSGLGTDALRLVPVNTLHQMDVAALADMVQSDMAAGHRPFFVVGSAGTVDTGSVDPLEAIAKLAREHGLWFHVDGALGGLGVLSPTVRPLLRGMEQADSIALDFHKWGQVPYDAGLFLVRDQAHALDTFASPAAYLARHPRGLSAGSPWPCDLGPDLSRGFRALKTWFTLMTHGTDRLGATISHSCALAQHLKHRVQECPELELMAPVTLSIVCFRHRGADTAAPGQAPVDADAFNADLVADLQESGVAAPSTTRLSGRTAIRAAIINHRTTVADIDMLVDAVLACGRARLQTTAR
jgi:glutamate/tyrosine decarboxylase-like PLP-dependent enzyme